MSDENTKGKEEGPLQENNPSSEAPSEKTPDHPAPSEDSSPTPGPEDAAPDTDTTGSTTGEETPAAAIEGAGRGEPISGIFEAIQRKDLDAVVPFLEKRSVLSALDAEGRTPLQAAAATGSLEIVKFLIECGAGLESKGRDGRTALMQALSGGHLDVAEYLLSKGASVNISSITNYTPLMQAAAKGAVNIVRIMLPKMDNVNSRDSEGRTALMIAARFGHRDILDLLIGRGASLLITDNKTNSAISYAETTELKQYLTQKAEAERKTAEQHTGKESKEEISVEEIKKTVEEVKKRVPSLLLLLGILAVTAVGGYFVYYQYEGLKVRDAVISPQIQQAGALIADTFCKRMATCRANVAGDSGFQNRCVSQMTTRWALFLADQQGEQCDPSRTKTCGDCVEGLPCDRITTFDFNYLERHCNTCFKVCAPTR